MKTNDVVVFRPMRVMAPASLAAGAGVVSIGAIKAMDGSANAVEALTGLMFIVFGIVLMWIGIHFLAKSTSIGPNGIVERALGGERLYKWESVFIWMDDEGDDERSLRCQFYGNIFPKTWHDSDVGRPGFDRFLELFRRYAGDKERPSVL